MSVRLLAGAGAVLRREGLVRALDLAARRPFGHPRAVLGGVAVLVPGRGIFAPVGLGGHLGLEERVHRRVGLVRRALVVDAVRGVGEAVGRAAVLERLPDLHAGAREVLLESEAVWKSNFGRPTRHRRDDELCYTSLDKCSAKAAAYPSLKVCCFAERIIEPTTLDECDPNNTHSVAWIDRPTSRARGKKNSTFFKNMGYRGQSCDDWITLMRYSFD